MTDLFDFFADLDAPPPAPIAKPCQPEGPDPQPSATICQPAPDPRPAWRYVAPPHTPPGLIAFRCMCGALDERPAPDLENVTCWKCAKPEGMRPLPWRPTIAEMSLPVVR